MRSQRERKIPTAVFTCMLLICLLILAVVSLRIGSVYFTVRQIAASFMDHGSKVRAIVIDLRLPRVILSVIIGACLSASGVLLQAVMQNPLADPGIIGVSSGASAMTTAVFLVFPTFTQSVPLFAFLGAVGACAIIYAMAWRHGTDPVRIVLAGVAVNAVLGGTTSLLMLMNSENLQGVLSWLNGSLSAKSWSHVRLAAMYGAARLGCAMLCLKSANTLQLGEEAAQSLGMKTGLARIALSAVAAFLAASSVSLVGVIGFVGLIVPHVARMFVGSNHKALMPGAMLLGACVMLTADLIGRTIAAPVEIPVGIVMSVLGGPFFLYLLRKQKQFGV